MHFAHGLQRREKSGFALIVALLLMGLLFLLLVSLSTTTMVQVQSNEYNVQARQARENALFALQVAIGELQSAAGPDMRVTATAALGSADTYQGANGTAHRTTLNGLVAPADGGRNWTGVWGNPDASQSAYGRTPTPVLLNWLVSGNERTAFSATAAGTIANYSAYGESDGDIRYAPDSVPAGASNRWALLVGQGTVGQTADEVRAPLVSIGEGQQDRYAWWIGDEGVKARYNIGDPYDATGGAAEPVGTGAAGSERHRLSLSQRNGIELMEGMEDFEDTLSTAGRSVLNALAERRQVGLTLGNDYASGDSARRLRFHDFSLNTMGVLSDSLNGGLRRDLGYLLATEANSGRIVPATANNGELSQMNNPRWEHLNSYYQQVVDTIGDGHITPVVGDNSTHHLTPVIVQSRLLFRLRVVAPADATATAQGQAYIGFAPIVVLGNPYNVPLKSEGVEFRWHGQDSSGQALSAGAAYPGTSSQMLLALDAANSSGDATWLSGATQRPRLFRWQNETGSSALIGNAQFRTGAFEIAPGQTKVFSLAANYTLSGNAMELLEMREGTDALTPDFAADLFMSNISGDKFNEVGSVVNEWTLKMGGHKGYFSLSMYPLGEDSPPRDPLAVRPLQRVEKIGLGMSGSEASYAYVFAAPEVGSNETFHYYISRNDSLQMPAYQDSRRRIYADYNVRTQLSRRPSLHVSANNPMTFVSVPTYVGPGTEITWMDNLNPPQWGRSVLAANGVEQTVLFDMRHSADTQTPLLSVAALRHANLTFGTDDSVLSELRTEGTTGLVVGENSGYTVGSGWGNPYVAPDRAARTHNGEIYYDMGYLLNTALFDTYFFSTLSPTATAIGNSTLPNSRFVPLDKNVGSWTRGRDEAANLMLGGAFNVNSTSVEAWKAVLGGMRFKDTGGDTYSTIYARSLEQPLGTGGNTGVAADAYAGTRRLSDDQVGALAEAIVSEVRQRGPFMSLSQFVNRRLENSALGTKGALQRALDRVDDATVGRINDAAHFDNQAALGSGDAGYYLNSDVVLGAQGAGAPGWLTQADLLQSLGPVLAARSDTFVIRAYGEVRDQQGQTVAARAWCEALVQRFPSPVNAAAGNPNEPVAEADSLGRRFQIVSFRWLGEDEI